MIYFFLLLSMWVLGFFNALVHAKDAWATMPEGLFLSAVTALAGARCSLDRLFRISLRGGEMIALAPYADRHRGPAVRLRATIPIRSNTARTRICPSRSAACCQT